MRSNTLSFLSTIDKALPSCPLLHACSIMTQSAQHMLALPHQVPSLPYLASVKTQLPLEVTIMPSLRKVEGRRCPISSSAASSACFTPQRRGSLSGRAPILRGTQMDRRRLAKRTKALRYPHHPQSPQFKCPLVSSKSITWFWTECQRFQSSDLVRPRCRIRKIRAV